MGFATTTANERDKATALLAMANGTIGRLLADLTTLATQRDAALATADGLSTDLETEKASHASALESAASQAETQREAAEKALTGADGTIRRLTEELTAATGSNLSLAAGLETGKRTVVFLSKALVARTTERDAATANIARLTEELDDATSSISRLKADLETQKVSLASALESARQAGTQLEAVKKAHSEERGVAEQQAKTDSDRFDAVTAELEALKMEHAKPPENSSLVSATAAVGVGLAVTASAAFSLVLQPMGMAAAPSPPSPLAPPLPAAAAADVAGAAEDAAVVPVAPQPTLLLLPRPFYPASNSRAWARLRWWWR